MRHRGTAVAARRSGDQDSARAAPPGRPKRPCRMPEAVADQRRERQANRPERAARSYGFPLSEHSLTHKCQCTGLVRVKIRPPDVLEATMRPPQRHCDTAAGRTEGDHRRGKRPSGTAAATMRPDQVRSPPVALRPTVLRTRHWTNSDRQERRTTTTGPDRPGVKCRAWPSGTTKRRR